MANEENLNHKLTVREQRKGGKNSVKSRKQKKTIQNILTALCDSKCSDIPQFKKIAAKLGLDGDKSVKELFTLVSTLNALKTAKMDDLVKMAELLGEQRELYSESEEQQTTFLEAIKKAVTDEDRENIEKAKRNIEVCLFGRRNAYM